MELKKLDLGSCRRWLAVLLAVCMCVGMLPMGMAYAAETADRELPSNPVHHCTKEGDGTDRTDWSYVYFGSYPQTEVTGDALTTAITGASYDSNGDAWVDGIRYRRASKSDANNTSYFGSSEYRYFKWERIKWRVLQNNGSTLFVVADKGLDCKDYNEEYTSITWENCTLRNWLNNDFYSTAFSGGEQGAIVEQTVVNEDNPYYGTEGGNDTRDKVFLLSIGEVLSPDYGFCESYSTSSASRWVKASDYAHVMGAYTETDTSYVGNSWWLLRSPGMRTYYATYGLLNGEVYVDGFHVHSDRRACVPALHINLSSDLWALAEEDVRVRLLYKYNGEWVTYTEYLAEKGTIFKEVLPDYIQEGIYKRDAKYYADEELRIPFDRNQAVSRDTTVYVVLGERYITPQNGTEVKPDTNGGSSQGQQPVSLTLSSRAVTVPKGKSVAITATVTPAGTVLTWLTSDASVAEVKNGTITGKKGGKAIITAQANGVKAECAVTVAEVSLNAKSTVLQTGTSSSALQIEKKYPSTDKVKSYKSSNTKIVKVNQKGKITAGKKTGSAVITVTMESGAAASCKVTVQKKSVKTKKLTLSKKKLTLKKGKSAKLIVTKNPITATEKITWTSSDKSIATVDKKGVVKAKKTGKAKITVKSGNGKKAVCTVTVK